MKNVTIRMRLILLIAFLLALLAGIGGAGLWAIDAANDGLQTVYTKRTVPMGQLGQIRYLIASNRLAIETTLITSFPEYIT
jgi:CHASE3 domain sensor protein